MSIKFGSNDNSGRRAERLSRVIGYVTAKASTDNLIGLWDDKGHLIVYISRLISADLYSALCEAWNDVEGELTLEFIRTNDNEIQQVFKYDS